MKYIPTIGLEIHAELKTESKMFCRCLNDPEETKPNLNVCPICLGHPGTLPVINKKAVEAVIKTGLALSCKIPDVSKFDRKNYFYPDLPKNYQISQYDLPLAQKGFLEIENKKIRINRIHLEEDTAKLVHQKGANYSLVDFNRAGRPLMELVTEPDLESGREAKKFCEELQLILRYLEVSEANMEKGQMRCEVNISLAPEHERKKLGTKVEIKNLNSFRAVERAVDCEIERQGQILEKGERIVQETRGWDEKSQKTVSQRSKEKADDYRYFPEPDLPPLSLKPSGPGSESAGALDKKYWAIDTEELKSQLPELPKARQKRFLREYELPEKDVIILVSNRGLADYFEQVVSELDTWLKIKSIDEKTPLIKLTANYFLTELQKLLRDRETSIKNCRISPENFAEFITMTHQGEISSSAAQAVLKEMFKTGADPSHIIDEKQLRQMNDEGALEKIVNKVIRENKKSVNDYKSGQEKALQFLVGQVMKESRGQANPQVATEILKKKLK